MSLGGVSAQVIVFADRQSAEAYQRLAGQPEIARWSGGWAVPRTSAPLAPEEDYEFLSPDGPRRRIFALAKIENLRAMTSEYPQAGKHYGPGDHPSGSPQSVHGDEGGSEDHAGRKGFLHVSGDVSATWPVNREGMPHHDDQAREILGRHVVDASEARDHGWIPWSEFGAGTGRRELSIGIVSDAEPLDALYAVRSFIKERARITNTVHLEDISGSPKEIILALDEAIEALEPPYDKGARADRLTLADTAWLTKVELTWDEEM